MTVVNGRIKTITGEGLPGVLKVSSDTPIRDESGSVVAIRVEPVEVECPLGEFTIELIPSPSTYRFTYSKTEVTSLYWSDNGTQRYYGLTHEFEGDIYAGAEHTGDDEKLYVTQDVSETTVLPEFHAVVPDRPYVNFSDLAPTGIVANNQDTSLITLALLLTTRPEYLDPIATKVAEIMQS
jgi:hypothetical protein